MLICCTGHQHFQYADNKGQAISGNVKPSRPEPDAAFVANQLIVRAAAKFSAKDESEDPWDALADLVLAYQLQPNDLPTLQLRALVRLDLQDTRGFLDDLNGRADTAYLLMARGQVSGRLGDNEQAVKDLVAADQKQPGIAAVVCEELEDDLNAGVAPQLSLASLSMLRHSIQARLEVSSCSPLLQ